MKKIYLIYSDNITPFNTLSDYCQTKFSNVVKIDADLLAFENATLSVQNIDFKNPKNKKLKHLTDGLIKVLDKENDNTFKLICNKIEDIDSDRKLIFLRVNNLKIITKLKRRFKRKQYITIHIDNYNEITKNEKLMLSEYTFDSIINNLSEEILNNQIARFVKKKVPSINYIHK